MSNPNRTQDLEDQIFGGGDSDLSDADADEHQRAPSPPRHDQDDEDGGLDERSRRSDDDDEDYPALPHSDSGSLPRIRKSSSKAPGGSSVNRPPKNRRTREQDESGQQPDELQQEALIDPEALRRQDLYDRIDQAAGKNKKGKKRRRKGGDEDLEMMADEEVSQLRAKMMDAVNLDLEANEERRPATAKMMLLPIVTSTMQKSHLESAILDNGVLEAVKKWLEPLPDKSLPSLNIQRSLMQLLTKMSIDTQSLKSSELGKIVIFYTKCKRVDPSIKRLADNLVTTWLRPIIRRSASYRSRAPLPVSSQQDDSEIINPVSRPIASGSGSQTNRNQRARIPETIHQAFQYAPTSSLANNLNSGEEGGSQTPAFRKGSQKATAKKTREWARKMTDAKKGQRLG